MEVFSKMLIRIDLLTVGAFSVDTITVMFPTPLLIAVKLKLTCSYPPGSIDSPNTISFSDSLTVALIFIPTISAVWNWPLFSTVQLTKTNSPTGTK